MSNPRTRQNEWQSSNIITTHVGLPPSSPTLYNLNGVAPTQLNGFWNHQDNHLAGQQKAQAVSAGKVLHGVGLPSVE